jgi:hypothetical protein
MRFGIGDTCDWRFRHDQGAHQLASRKRAQQLVDRFLKEEVR